MHVPEHIVTLARVEAQKTLDDLSGVKTVVLATIDGFEVVSASTDGSDGARVAAMASSISAISNVVSSEAELGICRSVVINTEGGFAIVVNVHTHGHDLLLSIVADERAVLGQVSYRAVHIADALAKAV